MIRTIIFDLSEVLIYGLVGVEKLLADRLNIDEKSVLPAFANELLPELFSGKITEIYYLANLIDRQDWMIAPEELMHIIRQNCQREVPGMVRLVKYLGTCYELVLLSDHAAELVEHIKTIHPFIKLFDSQFYSFQLGQTKRTPSTFQKVLEKLERNPRECLFVDDSVSNIRLAESFDIPSIHFRSAPEFMDALLRFDINLPVALRDSVQADVIGT